MKQLPLCAHRAQNPVKRAGKKYCSTECYHASKRGIKRGHAAIVTLNCTHCGATFQAQRSAKRRYCSSDCANQGNSSKVETVCATCGKTYLTNGRRNIRYCSRVCWRKGHAHKPQTDICEICGRSFTQPQTHKRKTCGEKCADIATAQAQSTKVTFTCERCGKQFTGKKGRKRKFCRAPALTKEEGRHGHSMKLYLAQLVVKDFSAH